MKRVKGSRVLAGLLLIALLVAAITAVAPASAASKTVNGSVGPGFTISVKSGGKKVSTLAPGTYRLTVTDRSSSHDFHLMGPGYNKAITSVGFKGTKAVTVNLRKGTYRYQCDPHASIMHGSFRVG